MLCFANCTWWYIYTTVHILLCTFCPWNLYATTYNNILVCFQICSCKACVWLFPAPWDKAKKPKSGVEELKRPDQTLISNPSKAFGTNWSTETDFTTQHVFQTCGKSSQNSGGSDRCRIMFSNLKPIRPKVIMKICKYVCILVTCIYSGQYSSKHPEVMTPVSLSSHLSRPGYKHI